MGRLSSIISSCRRIFSQESPPREIQPLVNPQDLDTFSNLAYGCVIGALCGDAIGVPVEFEKDVSLEDARRCLTLPGGGPFYLGKGQITDDSELALCQAAALVEGNGVLDLNKIGGMYHRWYLSPPFDIGIATKTAFQGARKAFISNNNHANIIRENSLKSIGSQSNGALMRITPLCVWASKLSLPEMMRAVREETRLTHPNKTTQNVSIAYVHTIHHLLNNPGESEQAYQKCKDLVNNDLKDKDMTGWLRELEAGNLPEAYDKMGWVKIAFLYSLDFMRRNVKYEDAMVEMLQKGGDTDTNCCIVGGMLGALHGLKGIPENVRRQVLSFDAGQDVWNKRPDYLVPGMCAEELIKKIIRIRPESLKIEGEEISPKL